MLSNEQLALELREKFGYLEDNNRDLISDPTFPMADAVEELTAKFAVDFLISYLMRATFDEAND